MIGSILTTQLKWRLETLLIHSLTTFHIWINAFASPTAIRGNSNFFV